MGKESTRVEALDAFRGVASFLIMVTHIILMVPAVCKGENLGAIYGGLSWKLPYFFVLSGFVLTLSYQRSRSTLKHPFRSFLLSRALRIYPLFLITTLVMFALKVAFSAGTPIDDASLFFNISWRLQPSLINLLHALTLVGFENTWLYNGPAWTLVFEMRYALFFPLIFGVLRRCWLSILLFFGLAFWAMCVSKGLERVDLFYAPNQLVSNSCSMLSFLLLYAGGIVLALHRDWLSKRYKSLSSIGEISFIILTTLAMLNPLWLKCLAQGLLTSITIDFLGDCIMLLGVMSWIVVLLNNQKIAAIFSKKLLIKLGRSSFSIYMWHTPIATAFFLTLHQHINIWYIVALSIITTLIVAPLSFRYIEQPVIRFSQRLRK